MRFLFVRYPCIFARTASKTIVLKKYSIKDIEKLTNVKAHTLRVWEQRYNFLVPHRTATNIRYYDNEQLKTLLNVSLLVNNGYRISKVSQLSSEELHDEVKKTFDKNFDTFSDKSLDFKINGLILAMLELDEYAFNGIYTKALIKRGMENALIDLIEPFLDRVQVMWRTGEISSAQERFIQNLIRQKLMVAIDALPIPEKPEETYLVYLSESQYNDLYTLLCIYMLKLKGRKIINLGQDIPITDLVQVVEATNPDVILTFFSVPTGIDHIQEYGDRLSHAFAHKRILIAGNVKHMNEMKFCKNTAVIESLAEFTDMLNNS
tara:strand:+ start:1687 stop:2646 length:960 start_codon:yes stop_codon:yes gene_type:complete